MGRGSTTIQAAAASGLLYGRIGQTRSSLLTSEPSAAAHKWLQETLDIIKNGDSNSGLTFLHRNSAALDAPIPRQLLMAVTEQLIVHMQDNSPAAASAPESRELERTALTPVISARLQAQLQQKILPTFTQLADQPWPTFDQLVTEINLGAAVPSRPARAWVMVAHRELEVGQLDRTLSYLHHFPDHIASASLRIALVRQLLTEMQNRDGDGHGSGALAERELLSPDFRAQLDRAVTNGPITAKQARALRPSQAMLEHLYTEQRPGPLAQAESQAMIERLQTALHENNPARLGQEGQRTLQLLHHHHDKLTSAPLLQEQLQAVSRILSASIRPAVANLAVDLDTLIPAGSLLRGALRGFEERSIATASERLEPALAQLLGKTAPAWDQLAQLAQVQGLAAAQMSLARGAAQTDPAGPIEWIDGEAGVKLERLAMRLRRRSGMDDLSVTADDLQQAFIRWSSVYRRYPGPEGRQQRLSAFKNTLAEAVSRRLAQGLR